MQFLNDYSNRELNIWAELVLDIIVSLYFISRVYPLLINDQFNSEALLPIIFTNIIISIIYDNQLTQYDDILPLLTIS